MRIRIYFSVRTPRRFRKTVGRRGGEREKSPRHPVRSINGEHPSAAPATNHGNNILGRQQLLLFLWSSLILFYTCVYNIAS